MLLASNQSLVNLKDMPFTSKAIRKSEGHADGLKGAATSIQLESANHAKGLLFD